MKKIIMRILTLATLCVFVFTLSVFAEDKGTGTVKVPTGSKYVSAKKGIKRSKKYSYIMAKANSVHPVGEKITDTYTRCKLSVRNGSKLLRENKVITEGTLYKLYLDEGKLNYSTFDLYFAGNSPDLAAYVAYYYNGK